MIKTKRYLVLLMCGLFSVDASSYEGYIFSSLSTNFDDDRCRQWTKINLKNLPSDLDLMSIHGPVKKLTMKFIVNNKPSLTIESHFDEKGVLIERVGNIPNQPSEVKLNSEIHLLMPYFDDRTRVNTNTNYDVTINKNSSSSGKKFLQFRETLIPIIMSWGTNQINIRRYVTKLLRIKIKGTNSKSSKINLKIENTHIEFRTLLYNPKKRSILHKFGDVFSDYKINYRTKYDIFDDKHPISAYDYFNRNGRLIKTTSHTGTGIKWTLQYKWDKNNRVKILKESVRNSYKHTETTYSYSKSHYTASISECDGKICKLKSKKTKPCYKRDRYGNALERFNKVNLTSKPDEKIIKIRNSYEYYK